RIGLSTAHSVVEPSTLAKSVAMTLVVLYAFITLVPLGWILLTSIKSPPDSISYPPKVFFEPSMEGYCNLFTTRSRQTEEYIKSLPAAAAQHHDGREPLELPAALPQYADHRRRLDPALGRPRRHGRVRVLALQGAGQCGPHGLHPL